MHSWDKPILIVMYCLNTIRDLICWPCLCIVPARKHREGQWRGGVGRRMEGGERALVHNFPSLHSPFLFLWNNFYKLYWSLPWFFSKIHQNSHLDFFLFEKISNYSVKISNCFRTVLVLFLLELVLIGLCFSRNLSTSSKFLKTLWLIFSHLFSL